MDTHRLSDEELASIIYLGHERPDLDYKGPGNWGEWSNEQKAELVRDMMGLGNSDVPGYIVIGATTAGGNVQRYDGLDEEQIKSFDPSKIADKVKRYADPEIRFEVHTPNLDGKWYVVIRVLPFQTLPHICRSSCGEILKEAAIYVRGEGARTIKVQSADHMRKLVNRAIQIDADNLVNRIRELILYSQKAQTDIKHRFEAQSAEIQKKLEESND